MRMSDEIKSLTVSRAAESRDRRRGTRAGDAQPARGRAHEGARWGDLDRGGRPNLRVRSAAIISSPGAGRAGQSGDVRGDSSGMMRSRALGVAVAAILTLGGSPGHARGKCRGARRSRSAPRVATTGCRWRTRGSTRRFGGTRGRREARASTRRSRGSRRAQSACSAGPRPTTGTGAPASSWTVRGVPPRIRRVAREMSPIHLSDWAQLVKDANAIPVFDLNMVTSTLPDQLEMLSAAKQLGMPIRRIELGNELYYRAPLVVKAFPTAAAYGREASRWIAAIKARYPKAQIAAVGLGYPPAAGDERQASWDRAGSPHASRRGCALAFHAYWPASRRRSLSGAKLSQELAAPLRLLRDPSLRWPQQAAKGRRGLGDRVEPLARSRVPRHLGERPRGCHLPARAPRRAQR